MTQNHDFSCFGQYTLCTTFFFFHCDRLHTTFSHVHVFCLFFFFFFLRVNSNLTWVHRSCTVYYCSYTVLHCSCTVYVLKNIKNGFHDTIYTFKNYFATVFSVFSFQFQFSATINSIQTDPLSNLHTTLYMTRNMLHRKFLTSQKDIFTQASGHVALFHLDHLFIYLFSFI